MLHYRQWLCCTQACRSLIDFVFLCFHSINVKQNVSTVCLLGFFFVVVFFGFICLQLLGHPIPAFEMLVVAGSLADSLLQASVISVLVSDLAVGSCFMLPCFGAKVPQEWPCSVVFGFLFFAF